MDSNAFPAERLLSRARQIAELTPNVAAVCVSTLGAGVWLGWLLQIPLLKTVLPGYTSMKPNTALAFVLSGVALWFIGKPNGRTIRCVLALLVAGLASLTLLEYSLGRSIGIDELVFRDPLSPRYPGRMAPLTAVSFVIVAAALLMHDLNLRVHLVSQSLLLFAAFGPMFGIVGYLYGVPFLYGINIYTAMAFHTGLGLLVLIVGVLFADPEKGIARIFLDDSSGGILARVAIPASILVPILLGCIFTNSRWNFGQDRLGSALIVIGNAAVFVALIWALAFFLQSRESQLNRAEGHANTDSLTGVMNRRYFETRLSEEIKRGERFKSEFSLILIDVDRFKALNDSMGHLVGDSVLRNVAQLIRASLREVDIVCRYGGEEFVVIAIQTDVHHALLTAEKLRLLVERGICAAAPAVRTTISAGISSYPRHGANRAQLLRAADVALYAAKELGRNRVEMFTEPAPTG
jgi:diguanylate cyclase (GGDEF)-like protein